MIRVQRPIEVHSVRVSFMSEDRVRKWSLGPGYSLSAGKVPFQIHDRGGAELVCSEEAHHSCVF
jgi:hypothetical protein